MVQRRLAAIMFTDIVGYTAMMGADEDKAFEVLRNNREIHTILIEQFKGTLIKEMGDGMLISFDLAADAVHCAIEIQKMSKDELDAQVRIGIHLGDITFENEDVFGDGVNLASRLQSITDPGGIYISESLQKSVRSKSDIKTIYLGEFKLKNVDYPVRTYAVQGGGLPVPTKEKIIELSGKSLSQRIFGSTISYIIFLVILVASVWGLRSILMTDELSKPKLFVVPLENYTGMDSIEHIISGIHTSLIAEIGKIGELNIISPYTSRRYKESGKSFKEIAAEENIDYIIEPTLSCIENGYCLNTIMIDMNDDENQIWIEDFIEEKSQVLNMYNKITKMVSEKINILLSPEEEELLAESREVDPVAYDLYMKGMVFNDQMSEEALNKAYQYFILAKDIDPNWAAPYQGIASVFERQYQMGFLERSVMMPKLNEYIDKALELDPNSSWIYNLRGSKAGWFEWEWEKAEQDFLKSIELNPNHAGNHAFYASLLIILRKPDQALYHANKAEELDPLNPFILGLCAGINIEVGKCQDAIELFKKANSIEQKHYFTYGVLFEASICIGDFHTAFEVMKERNLEIWQKYEQTEHFEKVFLEKGWSAFLEEFINISEELWSKGEHMNEIQRASFYIKVGNYDKAMDYFEKAYKIHSPNVPYISSKSNYNKMKDNPRYLELLSKLNLPVD